MNNQKKEIQIINGDGKNLNFSPVYQHLKDIKPKSKEENSKKNILIPNELKKTKK